MVPNVSTDPKVQIREYLFKQTGQMEFAPGLDLELPRQVTTLQSNVIALEQRLATRRASPRATDDEAVVSGKPTGAALEVPSREAESTLTAIRGELVLKREELLNQDDAYIRSARQQMKQVRSYDAMYRIVGQLLATADGLLADPDRTRQRTGLKMAREACGQMRSDNTDVWLAARICEAYFWPNLALADADPNSHQNALELLETSRRVFFETYETNNMLKNYNLLLLNAPNAKAADTFRVQLADWLEEKGSVKHAAEILNEIRDTEVLASAQERIVRVRQRVAGTP